MTLAELRYIIAIARERHFGRAADACFVAQPTLSVAVKKLEDELGVALFERTSQEVRATPIGEQVVEQAGKVLAEVARLAEMADVGKDPLAGPLRIGVIPTIAPWLLPKLVPLLKGRAPAMPLFLEETFTQVLLARLKSGELDVAILALPIDEPGLQTLAVYDEEFRVLVPADHPWVARKAIDPAELYAENLLMLGSGNCFRDQVLDLCAIAINKRGESPHVIEGSSLETIRHMVASGVGITVMPASAVDSIPPNDALLCVRRFADPQPTRRVGMVWRTTFPRHRALDVVRGAMLDCRLPGTNPVETENRMNIKYS
ncbi:MAG: LysR family transcriptional regulator [Gallionellaceae bacterium]|nr:LysR family transcriptional regulator [Gallionellaceae bacterium]